MNVYSLLVSKNGKVLYPGSSVWSSPAGFYKCYLLLLNWQWEKMMLKLTVELPM